jgi:hypothetical protein
MRPLDAFTLAVTGLRAKRVREQALHRPVSPTAASRLAWARGAGPVRGSPAAAATPSGRLAQRTGVGRVEGSHIGGLAAIASRNVAYRTVSTGVPVATPTANVTRRSRR